MNKDALVELLRNIELEQAPVFPQAELEQFVSSWLARRDIFLQLHRQTNAPLYVLDSTALLQRAQEFRATFAEYFDNPGIFFAMKSNNHPEVCRILTHAGLGMDVSGGPELQLALEQDVAEIVFSGPGKTEAELRLALAHIDRVTILADSFGELGRISRLATELHKTARIGVRLTTSSNPLWDKFGIAPDRLLEFFTTAARLPRIDFCGLQFHTSWNMGPAAQTEFIKQLGGIIKAMPRGFLERLEFLDIGGGYWPECGEWLNRAATPAGTLENALGAVCVDKWKQHYCYPAASLQTFIREISTTIDEYIRPFKKCRICCEPGRWLCNSAMQLVLTVVDKKSAEFVITDAGTNAIGWERFEYDYFPVINLSRPELQERKCRVLGSLCSPHDVWGYSYWGSGLEAGDVLLIPWQGAYTYSLRQEFIKQLPQVVVI